jgi:hypothetical protein
VSLFPDGTAQLFYDDDKMFGGHCLIAHLETDGTVNHDVELFG